MANGLSHHTNQDKAAVNGFCLFVWDLKKMFVAVMI
jgi:hypothetical protein